MPLFVASAPRRLDRIGYHVVGILPQFSATHVGAFLRSSLSLSRSLSLSLLSLSSLSVSLSLSLAPAVTFSIIYTTVNTQMRALQASFPIRKDMLYESVVADEVHDWPSYLR